MPANVIIPRLGWAMEEGVFVGWLKQDGDTVREGDTIFSLEGEKAVEEVESLDSGILRIPPDGPKQGDRVPVGAVIGYLVQAGEAAPFEVAGATPAPATTAPAAAPANGEANGTAAHATADHKPAEAKAAPPAAKAPDGSAAHAEAAPGTARKTISPRARRVAGELGVDWQQVNGTGSTGRIRERDIIAASQAAPSPPARASRAPVPAPAMSLPPGSALAPVTQLRRTIADRMLNSQACTAPVTLTTTVDVGNLVQLRKELKACTPPEEVPSFIDFLIKLVVPSLLRHPLLNSQWHGDSIVTPQGVHVGVAVDTDAGLLVPVLHDAGALDATADHDPSPRSHRPGPSPRAEARGNARRQLYDHQSRHVWH